MTAPRLEIDLDKIHHNARALVQRLGKRGISVTGVTKATLGSLEIAGALLRAGVRGLGDSRIENIEAMCRANVFFGSCSHERSSIYSRCRQFGARHEAKFKRTPHSRKRGSTTWLPTAAVSGSSTIDVRSVQSFAVAFS
jgi:hypothetical protein